MGIVEPKEYLFKNASNRALVFLLRIKLKLKERHIKDVEYQLSNIKKEYDDLISMYNERNNDKDSLQGIGIERRDDGAWLFNFKTLIHRLDDDGFIELKEAIKLR